MRVPCYSCFLAGGNVMCNWESFHLMKGVEYYEMWWRDSMTARQTPNPATMTAGQPQTTNPSARTAGQPVLSASGERENEAQLERDAVDVLAAAGSTRAREATPLNAQKRRKMKRSSNMPSQMHQCKDGNLLPFHESDCPKCSPVKFCEKHWTREKTHPRARDCARCKEERGERGWSRRKNKCSHHKPECVDETCLGCLRKDRCINCSACKHGILRTCCVECKPTPRGYPSAPPMSPSLSGDEGSF